MNKLITDDFPPISNLPNDILLHILCFLPTKSILLCKCVSKLWCSIIRNPQFNLPSSDRITLLVNRIDNDTNNISNRLDLIEPDIDFVIRQISDVSFLRLCTQSVISNFTGIPVEMFQIVGSCHGLVCLKSDRYWGSFFVCNPLTSEYVSVQQKTPLLEIDEVCLEQHSGFGFSAQSSSYKILTFFSYKKRYIDDERPMFGKLFAEIYTLGCDSEWRRVENPPQNCHWEKNSVFFEGALHWIILPKDGSGGTIVAFNFHDEKFSLLSLPTVLSSNDFPRTPFKSFMNLATLQSRLCFCVGAYDRHCDIWVMDEYGVQESWRKLFVVSVPGFVPLKPLAHMKNGEILMLTDYNQLLLSYNVGSNKCTVIQFPGCIETVEAMLFSPVFAPIRNLIAPH